MLFRQLETLGLLTLTSSVSAIPHSPRQNGDAFPVPNYSPDQGRADAVKEAFQFGWDGYMKHAFPHDSLKPVDNGFEDDRNGWGATAIDALSTAIIMGNREAVNSILDHIAEVDFSYSAEDVSFFETSIRYLAGMLSGYDLLDGPASDLIDGDQSKIEPVLQQAKALGDLLKVAFSTPSGLPVNGLEFQGNGTSIRHDDPQSGAVVIDLLLEWQRLSDLTGDPEYGELDKKAVEYLINDPQPPENVPWPGLIGTNWDPNTGKAVDADGGWVSGMDSHYEYLIKAYLYNKEDFQAHRDAWSLAADSSIAHLASQPSSRDDITFLAAYSNQTLDFRSEHLACFHGGNFILGGTTLGNQKLVDFGLNLTNGCHETYIQTATGLGPGGWNWQDAKTGENAPPDEELDNYNERGFWITGSDYALRPEVIESYYYAYRVTGDTMYQDWAWDAFVNINSTCRTGSGFAELLDVDDLEGGFNNLQDTFFFAEVLKYLYLIFSEEADWQFKVDQTNTFVFNTEAHPIRLANDGTG
ncbi:maturation of Asn-linked oligosaccharides protein [Arachnomyces sp. PD_36]|nr:maturation of Asn-linked oligosaccharides protein [Arachnomyces sp. PD_36]